VLAAYPSEGFFPKGIMVIAFRQLRLQFTARVPNRDPQGCFDRI
jgi:hypothetical protein